MKNHFALFGLRPVFAIETADLEQAYLGLQAIVHPDRFAQAGDAERHASLEWTTRLNEAYRTLKSPVQRARHLLELNGVDVAFETNTAMPADFLRQQLELREALEQGVKQKNPDFLEEIRKRLFQDRKALESQIAERIDVNKDHSGAAGLVRKLQFLERLDAQIDAAFETIE